jgi:hypothetical protein
LHHPIDKMLLMWGAAEAGAVQSSDSAGPWILSLTTSLESGKYAFDQRKHELYG